MALFAAFQQLRKASLDSVTSVRAEADARGEQCHACRRPLFPTPPIHMPSHGCRRTVGGVAERSARVGCHAVCLTAFKRREKVSQELCIFAL